MMHQQGPVQQWTYRRESVHRKVPKLGRSGRDLNNKERDATSCEWQRNCLRKLSHSDGIRAS